MSKDEMIINAAYQAVSREIRNDTIQELDAGFYLQASRFLGQLRGQEFDSLEKAVKQALTDKSSDLILLLIRLRLAKARKTSDISGLVSEERYIMDSDSEMQERAEIVRSSILHGRTRLLESISASHKGHLITVRFLDDMEEFVGADMQQYGPYKTEDIATIPYDNAHALILRDAVIPVRAEQ